MGLSKTEKQYMAEYVRGDLARVRASEKLAVQVKALKGEHDIKHFLEGLLKKLEE